MKKFAKFIVAGLIAAGAAIGVSAPAQAGVSFEIGVGGPGYEYYGYDYYRPCRWYFEHEYPAPRRCYRDYIGFYGPHVYISDGFVFRDRGHWNRWRVRDDYRHWRGHDWRVRERHDRRVDRRLDRRINRLERHERHERHEHHEHHHHH